MGGKSEEVLSTTMEEILSPLTSPLPPELSPHSQVLPSLTSSTSHLTSLMSDSPTSTSLLSSVLSSNGPDVGLPPALHQLLLSHSDDHGTARSGCDDGFGFLGFLLALLDLLLDLGGSRRKRSAEGICEAPQ